MKYYIYLFFAMAMTLSCCKNDDDLTPIEQLPPPTTEGKNTIGCLVNGQPFTDKGIMNNFYQFVNGEYYLVINWNAYTKVDSQVGQIALSKIQVEEGKTYDLNFSPYTDGEFTGGSGTYVTNMSESIGQYETNQSNIGKITFKRFDEQNGIMSGTFEFEAQEILSGKVITITDGRFDLRFTN